MFWEIYGDVYQWIRKSSNLSQTAVGAAIGRKRHTVRRWEDCETMPQRDQEEAFFRVTHCTRARFAEMVCKKLTRYTGRPVVMLPKGQIHGMPTTPLGEAQALVAEHYAKIPPKLRDRLLARISRLQVMEQIVEQDLWEMVGDVEACLEAIKVMKGSDRKR